MPKFKWHHLTEKIAYEKAIKEQRLKAEIEQAKRENNFYLQNVEKAKMIQSIEERKKKKSLEEKKVDADKSKEEFEAIKNRFRQRKAIKAEEKDFPSNIIQKLLS